MEYYAKSNDTKKEVKNVNDIRNILIYLLDDQMDKLNENESKMIISYLDSLKQQTVQEQKTLREHEKDIVNCAGKFFEIFDMYFTEKEKNLVLEACRVHDLGKANYIFQTIVNPGLARMAESQIPHGFLSALSLSEKQIKQEIPGCTDDDFSVLLTAVYYHHDRKDSFSDRDFYDYYDKWYKKYLQEYLGKEDVKFSAANRNQLLYSNNPTMKLRSVDEPTWCEYMLIKGLLNKFDWTVSAGYEEAELHSDIAEKKLCSTIRDYFSNSLRELQVFMQEHSDDNVVVIAPTGSGKTEAALLWANGEKGFYTLPLKVSSNAIYSRIKDRYMYKDVALLHSDSLSSYFDGTDGQFTDGNTRYEQAKLFSYPLTVCTVDQLFKFVYKAPGTEIFAATLKYSKLIIDEIQSYSPKIVAALIYGLSELKRMEGKFAIITATFPPVLEFFMRKYGLIKDRDYIFRDFSTTMGTDRHRIALFHEEFDFDRIAEDGYKKKVLVICNTVSKAQKVYEELSKRTDEVFLLHSRYIRKHRDQLEKMIMDFSDNDEMTGIWVTTQIVEASLDIDFDVLYTEMCTADSLLQRMGRCNRAGKKDITDANVLIYVNYSGCMKNGKGIYDSDIYDRSVQLLVVYNGELFAEKDKVQYMNEVYDVGALKNTAYFQMIKRNLAKFKSLQPLDYTSKKDIDEDFRGIKSITVIPDRIYQENQDLIEAITGVLDTPYVESNIRRILKAKLADITLNLNLYSDRRKLDGVDLNCINDRLDIHRTCLLYDFDEMTGRGMGLSLTKYDDEWNFI